MFLISTHFPRGFDIALSQRRPSIFRLRDKKKSSASGPNSDDEKDASSQLIGVTFLFISLCFDGGTGAYEDKLMSVHSVGPFGESSGREYYATFSGTIDTFHSLSRLSNKMKT